MRFNPFRPNSIAPVGLFEGRVEETRALDGMLNNTMLGNPQHFLIHGERGIGKSSLLFVEELTAKGSMATFDGDKFNFLVVSISLENTDSHESIINKLGKELRAATGKAEKGKEALRKIWEVVSRFEAAGVKLRKREVEDIQSPLMDLCAAFTQVCENIKGFYDGVLVLIDEADKAPVSAQLGSTLKTLTERVSRSENYVLAIGLAGTSSLINSLRESHESAPRLFTHFHLKALQEDETEAVIDAAIEESNQKSTKSTSISADAKQMLVKLSEGYPNFIQEFGFFAFQSDADGLITIEDVQDGAWSEHGAFAQLGEKYFKHLYLGKIASDSYRSLLQVMAKHEDNWVTKEQLRTESGLSPSILTNALQALLSREIILSREGKKGFYRLPSKSFSAWLRARDLRSQSGTVLEVNAGGYTDDGESE